MLDHTNKMPLDFTFSANWTRLKPNKAYLGRTWQKDMSY